MTWLVFTLIATIASGIFGVLTHAGQKAMEDSANGQYKALLFAGIGYSGLMLVPKAVEKPTVSSVKVPLFWIADSDK